MSEIMAVGYARSDQATTVVESMRQLEVAWLNRNMIATVVRNRRGDFQMLELRQLARSRDIPWCVLWRNLLYPTLSVGAGSADVITPPASAVGIPDTFVKDVVAMLDGVQSALIIWAKTRIPPRVYAYVSAAAQDVVRTPLSASQNALLVSVLDVLGPSEANERQNA